MPPPAPEPERAPDVPVVDVRTDAPTTDRLIDDAFAPLAHGAPDDDAHLAALFDDVAGDDTVPPARNAMHEDAPPPATTPSTPARTGRPHTEASAAEPDDVTPKRSRWPLVVFGVIAFLLVGLSFIWYVNPYPPLRDAISTFFKRQERTRTVQPAAKKTTRAAEAAPAPAGDSAGAPRDWDYFIQVSSWKELGTAQREANLLRARQLTVAVEGDFNRTRRGTVFRVRIGPIATRAEAAQLLDSLKGALPAGAFIDSVRTTGATAPPVTGPQIMQPAAPPTRQERAGTPPPASTRPSRGFAVKVSSYRAKEGAASEANGLVKKGFPAYVVPVMIGEVQWYRVLVGPLSTREEADRYARSVRSISGNEAFVIELGR